MFHQHGSRWLSVLVVCLCVMLHHSRAHPCGENPLRRLVPLTRILNVPNGDINAILNALRTSQPELYREIQEAWQAYSRCIGLVDTGYFKRSYPGSLGERSSDIAQPTSRQEGATSKNLEEKANLLMKLLQ